MDTEGLEPPTASSKSASASANVRIPRRPTPRFISSVTNACSGSPKPAGVCAPLARVGATTAIVATDAITNANATALALITPSAP